MTRPIPTIPSDLEGALRDLIVDQLGIRSEEITREASFKDDLGADSLDAVELAIAIEEWFHIVVEEADGDAVIAQGTVGDCLAFITAAVTKMRGVA